jgi:hypothetical protein
MLQGSLHVGWHSVPCLSVDSEQAHQKEPPYAGHRVRSQPRREVYQRDADELGKLPRQCVGEGLSQRAIPWLRVSL